MNEKINKDSINYVELAEKAKNEYDRYLEKADFTPKAFEELLSKVDNPRKQELLNLSRILIINSVSIKLDYATGTYVAYIPTSIGSGEYFWIYNYLHDIFDVEFMKGKDGDYLVKKFDDFDMLRLSDFFFELTEEDKKIFDSKKVLTCFDAEEMIKGLTKKISRTMELVNVVKNSALRGSNVPDIFKR